MNLASQILRGCRRECPLHSPTAGFPEWSIQPLLGSPNLGPLSNLPDQNLHQVLPAPRTGFQTCPYNQQTQRHIYCECNMDKSHSTPCIQKRWGEGGKSNLHSVPAHSRDEEGATHLPPGTLISVSPRLHQSQKRIRRRLGKLHSFFMHVKTAMDRYSRAHDFQNSKG